MVKTPGLPNIIGNILMITGTKNAANESNGAFKTTQVPMIGLESSDIGMYAYRRNENFDASLSNAIYGASTTVQPPAIVLIPQIRY